MIIEESLKKYLHFNHIVVIPDFRRFSQNLVL